jgi:hypothetical protein
MRLPWQYLSTVQLHKEDPLHHRSPGHYSITPLRYHDRKSIAAAVLGLTCQLITIVVRMNFLDPPTSPYEAYSQGLWYAVIAAVIYFVSFCTLILNMLGYCLGHYHQRFELNDHQRTLIIQAMLFFAWLAGGGAVFSKIESLDNQGTTWQFVDGVRELFLFRVAANQCSCTSVTVSANALAHLSL